MKTTLSAFVDYINTLFKRERQALLLLFLLAIIIRTLFVIIHYNIRGTDGFSDAWRYLAAGEEIAKGNWNPARSEGHPFMMDAPWIPMMAALCYKLFGMAIIPMFIYNIIIGSLTIPVLYFLGKEVFNQKLGWGLAIWAVFYYISFRLYPTVQKEPTLLLMFPLSLLFLIKSMKGNLTWKPLAVSALAFAVLIHTDERFIVYLPLLALFFLLPSTTKPVFGKIKPLVAWLTIVILLMLPWSIRNYHVFDQVVIIAPRTTVFTSKLWGETIMSENLLEESRGKQEASSRADDAKYYSEKFGIQPKLRSKREAQLMAFVHFWQPTFFKPTFIQYGYRIEYHNVRANIAFMLVFGVFLPFYIIGIFKLMKKKYWLGLLLAAIPIIHSLMHAYMVWPLQRYRVPVEFLVVMVGMWAAIELYYDVMPRFLANKSVKKN